MTRRRGLGPLRHLVTTGSTNDDLAGEARGGDPTPAVLVTDHQTAGRGRRDRGWDDTGHGDLLVSIRRPTKTGSALGLAVCLAASAVAAADSMCPVPVRSKWPNDLVIETGPVPGKLGGMLSELVVAESTALVLGLGINLEPVPGQPGATSIRECGGSPDRDALLEMILEGFADRLADPDSAGVELKGRSATLGRRVRVEFESSSIVGTAVDVTDDGLLVVATAAGDRTVSAGDVVHLRPAEGRPVD